MKRLYTFFKIGFVSAYILLGTHAMGQTDVQISYFMNNELSFNPSFAGANDGTQVSLLARQQWITFDKAPATQTLHADTKTKFGGFGIYVINDGLGYERSMLAKVQYANRVKLAEDTYLALGFGAGFYNRVLDGDQFVYQDPATDPNGIYTSQSYMKPTLDFGLHLSHKNLNIGFSSTHINKSLNKSDFANLPRHYYGYLQYEYDMTAKVSLVPTVYVKSGGYITQAEANCNIFFSDKFWLGGTYRLNESAVAMAGVILKEKIKIGYAYDFSVGAIGPHSNGNHEIILSLRFNTGEKEDNTFYQSTRLFN